MDWNRQVQMEVDKARDVFKRFNQLENGQENLVEHPARTWLKLAGIKFQHKMPTSFLQVWCFSRCFQTLMPSMIRMAGDLQLVVAFYAWRLLPGESFSSTLCSSHQKAVSRLHKATRILALLQEVVVSTRLKIPKHSRFFDRMDRIFQEFRKFRKALSEI